MATNTQAFTSSQDTRITYEQKRAIRGAVRARAGDSRRRNAILWSRLAREFDVPTYTELPAHLFAEAFDYVARYQFTDEEWAVTPTPEPGYKEAPAPRRPVGRPRKAQQAAAPEVPESILYLLAVLADFSSALKDFREDKDAAQWLDAAYIKALQQ